MIKTGLYIDLFTNEIIESDVVVDETQPLIHKQEVEKLTYLGLKEELPTTEVLLNTVEDYCSLFTKEELPQWLSAKRVIVDVTNSIMGCYSSERELLGVKTYYLLEFQSFKDLFNNLGIEFLEI